MRIVGVIPAAGLSARMGRPKLALPYAGRTLLERVIDAVRAGGVAEVLVVLGPASLFLKDLAERAGARVLTLGSDTPDMRATVLAGLRWLDANLRPGPEDGWLLLPADHPTLASAVVAALRTAAADDAAHSIFVPAHQGQRGHPTLFRWRHTPALLSLPEGQGLNSYLRANTAAVREIDWPTSEVLRDLDTPADYERLLQEPRTK